MQASGLDKKVVDNIFNKILKAQDKWFEFINGSFLPDDMQERYRVIIADKLAMLR